MAKCPKQGCGSTEFEVERIEAKGYIPKLPVIVCSICGTIIGLAPNIIEGLIRDVKGKIR
jgi:hypothetical protein